MTQITDAITAGAGKFRKADDKRKNVRNAFRNSLNRTITAIGKYDKPPETCANAGAGGTASVAARPEPAPALGITGKKNQPRTVGFLKMVVCSLLPNKSLLGVMSIGAGS